MRLDGGLARLQDAGMGISYRLYLVQDDGGVWRISQRVRDDVLEGRAAMAEFAGTKQRLVLLAVQFENRKARGIVDYQGQIWSFDEIGSPTERLMQEHRARVDLLPGALLPLPPTVADERATFGRAKLQRETRWEVPEDLLGVIAADLGIADF